MENDEVKIKEDYLKNLDPKKFQEFKLEGLKAEKSENNYDFWFKCLHEFFSSGNCSGTRMLEIGSGPTVHNIATASAYFPYIVQSEFVESNCEQLRKWLRKDPDSLDWTIFLQRVARAEGKEDVDAAVPEIEDRIRSAVKAVVHADVLDDQVIPKEYTQEPYDLILSVLTFETAAVNLESYSKILGRANRLLRKGGKMILISATKCTYWQVGGNKFHCLSLEEHEIEDALKKNGFGEICWKIRERPDDDLPFNCKNVYFLTCTKL
ncbi:Indolethylamine N-methyltransferase [Araneus ventricosus]|uniref:Indolethylamine N-methyltransferase n=1 Tax=Araneus ventricosus TaxID=182803 RepID=A0A4Y2C0B9_ARAVE|nr:Indolethylamine N-methyltransferase [Araneus ventricosus]